MAAMGELRQFVVPFLYVSFRIDIYPPQDAWEGPLTLRTSLRYHPSKSTVGERDALPNYD